MLAEQITPHFSLAGIASSPAIYEDIRLLDMPELSADTKAKMLQFSQAAKCIYC
jgi:hypothetical protein